MLLHQYGYLKIVSIKSHLEYPLLRTLCVVYLPKDSLGNLTAFKVRKTTPHSYIYLVNIKSRDEQVIYTCIFSTHSFHSWITNLLYSENEKSFNLLISLGLGKVVISTKIAHPPQWTSDILMLETLIQWAPITCTYHQLY